MAAKPEPATHHIARLLRQFAEPYIDARLQAVVLQQLRRIDGRVIFERIPRAALRLERRNLGAADVVCKIEQVANGGDARSYRVSFDRIRSVLGWQPELDDLDGIVGSSLNWERKLLREPWQ